MVLDDLVHKVPAWLNSNSPVSEIVLSSRVRLARNLASVPFPERASKSQLMEVVNVVRDAVKEITELKNGLFIINEKIQELDREMLLERHHISKDFLRRKVGTAVVISPNEEISIMINEEDHLRIQVFVPALELGRAFEIANRIDDALENLLGYAFSTKWGYLTACPTNVGTGMRASVLLHLPGLLHSQKIRALIDELRADGYSVRGLYGEGTRIEGNFFQISNQVTLGVREEDIIENMINKAQEIIELEEDARRKLLATARAQLEDKIWRGYGILANARVLTSTEFVNLASAVRLGIGLGILTEPSIKVLNRLLLQTMPAHLQKIIGKTIPPEERDIRRALFVRKQL